jgi:hypothetical protein
MSRKRVILMVSLVSSLLVVVAAVVMQDRAHWYVMAKYWSGDTRIVFYGRVVDQAGAPIPGATVSISVNSFDPTSVTRKDGNHFKKHHLQRITDPAGAFSVEDERGHDLFIEKISCAGYVTIPERDWTYERYWRNLSFRYCPTQGNYLYIPDAQKPAIFPLRTEGEPRSVGPSKGGAERKVP